MSADLELLKQLHAAQRLIPHNFGPPPELVIQLFETHPEIWRANLSDAWVAQAGMVYSIPIVEARERSGGWISGTDVENTIRILDKHFYGCDALKIQAGAEFTGRLRNRPTIIFLWWD